MTPEQIEKTLFDLADIAEVETMARFRKPGKIENKRKTGFDPVTLADTQAEERMRQYLAEHYPAHGILGEEQEAINPEAEYCWIIDPIDGTRAFICGLPGWGTLIGLSYKGTPVAGMMAQPFTGERYFSCGGESKLKYNNQTTVLKTSNVTGLDQATVMTTDPDIIHGQDKIAFSRLKEKIKLTRYGYDCYAYAMVAAGHIELVVETELKPYDISALIPIIENAGGVVTDWQGNTAKNGGRIIAAANTSILSEALETINHSN